MDSTEVNNISTFNISDYFDGKTFNTKEFVEEYLIPKHNIISLYDTLHLYKDGIYIPNRRAIEKLLVNIYPFKKTQINEIIYYLTLLADDDVEEYSNCYIAFANGILPLDPLPDPLQPVEYNPKYIITGSKLLFSYLEPTSSNAVVDEIFNKLSRRQ